MMFAGCKIHPLDVANMRQLKNKQAGLQGSCEVDLDVGATEVSGTSV